MKIAILSDFHLGYERFREDAYRQAEEALNKASQTADAIIIPGDIFDNRTPKPDVLAEAINLFRGLSKKEWGAQVVEFLGEGQHYTKTPIIAIPGTHERRAQDVMDPVDLLGLTGLIVDVSNATAMLEKSGEKVAIVGIGGIADERFREIVLKINPRPVDGAFSVFMFHESVYELLPFNESFIKLEELPKDFDLYVCGHIHSRLESSVHGKRLLIPGSTVLTQLKSGEQEKKGFYVYDTLTGKYEFIEIDSRRFVVLEIGLDGHDSAHAVELIESGIKGMLGSDMPIIRVVLEGKQKSGDMEMELSGLPKRYEGRALVEISKSGIDISRIGEANLGLATKTFENMSVKDYGIGVFIEKLKDKNVNFGRISPIELLDILSSEPNKDKAVEKALNELAA
ncbi:MAG: DNA repair exonuclease [Candidatus Micrarchaeota archaeon]|nr:DNA repair exonuclease [Candidatus Micrarchaeota archaeon]MDE1859063.1 DNA repair exonuclease [Candidatus Micrarchaeota archaeon]